MPKFDPALLPPQPDLAFEAPLWSAGVRRVCGIDEAGRGALAGPVVAAALILPANPTLVRDLDGVRDSKQMTSGQREMWDRRLRRLARDWALGSASAQEIDTLGILPATCLAARRALEALRQPPDHLLIDHLLLPEISFPQTALTKGDARSLSIAAASVLAKVARDETMRELDVSFPDYGFAAHKGYATRAHRAHLARRGPSPVHRRTFAPLRPRA